MGHYQCVVKGEIHHQVNKTLHVQVDGEHMLDSGQQWHVKSGQKIVMESDREIIFYAGGSFIKIDHSGVYIKGASYNLGSGSAASIQQIKPQFPTQPMEANRDRSGFVSEHQIDLDKQRKTLLASIKKLEPFCAICQK